MHLPRSLRALRALVPAAPAIRVLPIMIVGLGLAAPACLSDDPAGIAPAKAAKTTVKLDFYHKPLPDLPLPNDIATRHDATSKTGRRINASMVAETTYEATTRRLIDGQDGWGVFMPITVPFTGPLDPASVTARHPAGDFTLDDDVIYLVDVDRSSPDFGTFHHLDLGQGNYPVVLERRDRYWPNDPRGDTSSLVFEEVDEDEDGDGVLDPGEDTDADGRLDAPNYLPGAAPAADDLAARADALMTFYERETQTLIARPMVPMRERTTYAVVITRDLLDADGDPVGSPYPFVNHDAQTQALSPLGEVLPSVGRDLDDVAFAFSFTTGSFESQWIDVRDGLYGFGPQKHLASEFPAEIGGLEVMLDSKAPAFSDRANLYAMHHEDWETALGLIASQFLGVDQSSVRYTKFMAGHAYVDFHVVGWFDAPQLFQRYDEDGRYLPLNEQSWPIDLHRDPVHARHERVYFHLSVPRKEASPRGEGKPAPIVIVGHGYTGNRFDAIQLGGYLARHGMAVLAIDNVSHGLELSAEDLQTASELLGVFGLQPAIVAMTQRHRAFDQNNDGETNSGGDFWTAYLFHTRDVVRQSALDYMQLIRILRGFDGTRRWAIDVDGDGQGDLAGDFDGDGVVDVGGEGSVTMMGASLGGIMSAVVGGIEPALDAVVPIAAGGGLGDVALRSLQGGVPEAVILRMLGPLFLGTTAADSDTMSFQQIVPDVNDDHAQVFASVSGVEEGDFIVVEDVDTGTRGCGYVWQDASGALRFRAGLEANARDRVVVRIYEGDAMVLGSTECAVVTTATERAVVDRFEVDGAFQGDAWKIGDPLYALAEGLGLPRASPRLRRFLGLAQLVLDGADPAVMARLMRLSPFTYPGTGETTATNMLLVTTAGDMNVPASTGTTIARAAGLVDYLSPHPDYGKTINQELIDTYTVEAVSHLHRFDDAQGNSVIMDVENFSGGQDEWTDDAIPRLDPPLRLGFDRDDVIKTPVQGDDGVSGAIFPFPEPGGRHGFNTPGEDIDIARRQCREACPQGETCPCDAIDDGNRFDLGSYLFNMMGHYLRTGGRELWDDACLSRDDCEFFAPVPEPRAL